MYVDEMGPTAQFFQSAIDRSNYLKNIGRNTWSRASEFEVGAVVSQK